jgi:hypothetical protein
LFRGTTGSAGPRSALPRTCRGGSAVPENRSAANRAGGLSSSAALARRMHIRTSQRLYFSRPDNPDRAVPVRRFAGVRGVRLHGIGRHACGVAKETGGVDSAGEDSGRLAVGGPEDGGRSIRRLNRRTMKAAKQFAVRLCSRQRFEADQYGPP